MSALVVDASVAVKWVVAEPGFEEARRLRGQHSFLAPELFITETANILWKKAGKGELTAAEATVAYGILMLAPIDIRPMRPLAAPALRLALSLAHPAYDCTYLALAAAEGVPMATADGRLARRLAAAGAGIGLPRLIFVATPAT